MLTTHGHVHVVAPVKQRVVVPVKTAATPVAKRVSCSEPLTRLHNKTNVDSAVVATVAIEIARTSILICAPVMIGLYFVTWVVLCIKTQVS